MNPDGSRNEYPWWVEDGKRGWSVNDLGKHLQAGTSEFDIVSRAKAEQYEAQQWQYKDKL